MQEAGGVCRQSICHVENLLFKVHELLSASAEGSHQHSPSTGRDMYGMTSDCEPIILMKCILRCSYLKPVESAVVFEGEDVV